MPSRVQVPADRAQMWLTPTCLSRSFIMASAMGERQRLPVQMNRTVCIVNVTRLHHPEEQAQRIYAPRPLFCHRKSAQHRLDQTIVAIPALVQDVDSLVVDIVENKKIVSQEFHLFHRFFLVHGHHIKALGADDVAG